MECEKVKKELVLALVISMAFVSMFAQATPDDAPGQLKSDGEPAIGVGQTDAPGQVKPDGEPAIGNGEGLATAPGQIKEPGTPAEGKGKA